MGKHLSDSLYTPCCQIMNSDDDQPIVMELIVGFNHEGRLMVCVDLTDYEEPVYNCSTAAVVNLEDSQKMSKRHHVKHHKLPKLISECMEEWSDIINPNFKQVRNCFKEITECLLDEGCRFKIERTLGKDEYICC